MLYCYCCHLREKTGRTKGWKLIATVDCYEAWRHSVTPPAASCAYCDWEYPPANCVGYGVG